MPERPFPSTPRPAQLAEAPTTTPSKGVALDPVVLKRELTPRTLFTNIFQVTLPPGALGAMQSAKADKEEFDDRKRPQFYQAGETVYCYGPGQEEFTERRFSSAIVTAETDKNFTKFLLARGLMDFFRARDFRLRGNAQGFTVQDHTDIIRSSDKGHLHIIPQFGFQPYWVESTAGVVRFAFSIEPGTTTLPTFHIHEGLRRRAVELDDLQVQLSEDGCKPGCPLYGRTGQVLGRFKGFAEAGATLDCTCHAESFDAVAIKVLDRHRKPGAPRRRRRSGKGPKVEMEETTLIIPGQLVVASPSQRRLLKLSSDRGELERAGKVWLGSLSADSHVRANALQVRYERIQQFLARMSNHQTNPLAFSLPTGAKARLERMPLTVEELSDISGRDGSPGADGWDEEEESPYA